MDAPAPQPVVQGPLERGITLLVAHRMSMWLWVSIALSVAIFFVARHMLSVLLWKVVLLTIAGYIGYTLSLAIEGALALRGDNRRKRPHEIQQEALELRAAAATMPEDSAAAAIARERAWQLEQMAVNMLWRRSMIVSAALIASAMGG